MDTHTLLFISSRAFRCLHAACVAIILCLLLSGVNGKSGLRGHDHHIVLHHKRMCNYSVVELLALRNGMPQNNRISPSLMQNISHLVSKGYQLQGEGGEEASQSI